MLVSSQNAISSIPFNTLSAISNPDFVSGDKSFWEESPVIMTFEPNPILVKNIFI